jgi:hypothetical protein
VFRSCGTASTRVTIRIRSFAVESYAIQEMAVTSVAAKDTARIHLTASPACEDNWSPGDKRRPAIGRADINCFNLVVIRGPKSDPQRLKGGAVPVRRTITRFLSSGDDLSGEILERGDS